MFRSSIPKEDVRQLPLIKFEGTIHVLDTPESFRKAINQLRKENCIGFDTETKPTFKKGDYNHTALVQLSTMDDAYIFRIHELGFNGILKDLMEDDGIEKVGISIRDDLKDLKKMNPFKPAGFIDLNDIAKDLGISQIGMRSLTGIFLESRISKSQQTSNWENEELSAGQQTYAATDAWVCLKIYQMLEQKGFL
tara:strand:+ start:2890 stop:3471 length:582 start_codon:yes stop_codon:yes gene_type:complete